MPEKKRSAPYYVRLTVQECAGIVHICQSNGIKLPGISAGVRQIIKAFVQAKAPEFAHAAAANCFEFLEASGVTFARSNPQRRGIYRQLLDEASDVVVQERTDFAADVNIGAPRPFDAKKSRYLELVLMPERSAAQQAEMQKLEKEVSDE